MTAAILLHHAPGHHLEFSSEHADFFARNLIMVRIEERLALAMYQPAAFVHGDFDDIATSGA